MRFINRPKIFEGNQYSGATKLKPLVVSTGGGPRDKGFGTAPQIESHEANYLLSHHHLRKSTPTNIDMSLQDSDPRSLKRKRQLTGNSDKGEGSGGQDPGDVETRQSSAPELGVPSQGQELDTT